MAGEMRPKRPQVSSRDIEDRSYVVWNAFIHFVSRVPFDDASEVQRNGKLVLLYEALVQNGGHCHFLDSQGLTLLENYPAALFAMGAAQHAEFLRTAIAIHRRFPDLADFESYDDAFAKLDADKENCLTAVMTRYLYDNLEDFVEPV